MGSDIAKTYTFAIKKLGLIIKKWEETRFDYHGNTINNLI